MCETVGGDRAKERLVALRLADQDLGQARFVVSAGRSSGLAQIIELEVHVSSSFRSVRPRGWRFRLSALLLGIVGVLMAGVMPANASVAGWSASSPENGTLAIRPFDAVTTAFERSGWKHMALIGEEYAIFDDRGLFEGPARIRDKWPFLPERFKSNIDAASVVFESRTWKYMFVQDTERIVFFDWGVAAGPESYNGRWPFLDPTMRNGFDSVTAHMQNNVWMHLATKGEFFATFSDLGLIKSGSLRSISGLPERFRSDLEDASIELEGGRWKVSFYKGGERIIFFDGGPIVEIVGVTQKWPFLTAWLTA